MVFGLLGRLSCGHLNANRGDIVREIGQLFSVGFEGFEPPLYVLEMIRRGQAGGIILFRRNIRTAQQVGELTRTLQATAEAVGVPPLLIAVDQEGGTVRRLAGPDFIPLPSQMAMAAANRLDLVERLVYLSALEMAVLGINQNYAPVLDVNVNPLNPVIGVRSFGEDPGAVARLGQTVVRALQRGGVLATGKHFPGHGDTRQDSHRTLPSVDHPRAHLESVELVPFRAAVASGIGALMTAHVVFSALEPSGLPATLSPRVLTQLARDEMNFSGLMVTDSMGMQAIAEGWGVVRGAELAVAAGADQVLLSHLTDHQAETYRALAQAFRSGHIPVTRFREALDRVRETKARIHRPTGSLSDAERAEAAALARDIWRGAVAGIGALERLPIADSVVLVTFGDHPDVTEAEDAAETPRHPLARALGDQLARHFALARDPSPSAVADVHRASRGFPLVVALDRGLAHPAQLTVLNRTWTDGPTIALALSSPYDLRRLPVGTAGLTGFDPSPEAMEALAAVLRGDAPVAGAWPITLNPRPPQP